MPRRKAEEPTEPVAQDEQPEQAETFDRVSVINRRLKNPFGAPSRDIPLKGEKRGWVVRTFVADKEHPNRHYDAVHVYGYVPLAKSDLAISPESIGYTVSPAGYIVRGSHGEELLCAIPRDEWEAVQQAKSNRNRKSLEIGKMREEVAQATAKEHGSEAGDHIFKNFTAQAPITENV